MLQAELHLNVSEFEDAVADFGLAERAASDAGLVESQVDAICGAALALFNLKRTSETRALGVKALELAHGAKSDTAVASSEIVLAMERMCMGDLDDRGDVEYAGSSGLADSLSLAGSAACD